MQSQNRGRRSPAAPVIIVSMSLQSAIPWRVALQQSPPPLRRLLSMLRKVAVGVNHHLMRGGDFSTGDLGNFHPALTLQANPGKWLKRNGGDDGARTRDLRRDRPNVSEISVLHTSDCKRLAESAKELFFRCYSTCYSSFFTSFSLGF